MDEVSDESGLFLNACRNFLSILFRIGKMNVVFMNIQILDRSMEKERLRFGVLA